MLRCCRHLIKHLFISILQISRLIFGPINLTSSLQYFYVPEKPQRLDQILIGFNELISPTPSPASPNPASGIWPIIFTILEKIGMEELIYCQRRNESVQYCYNSKCAIFGPKHQVWSYHSTVEVPHFLWKLSLLPKFCLPQDFLRTDANQHDFLVFCFDRVLLCCPIWSQNWGLRWSSALMFLPTK
jgi:hypothetical protein